MLRVYKHSAQKATTQFSKRALSLVDEFMNRGMSPDIVSYNTVLGCCEQENDVDIAIQVWQRIRLQGLGVDSYTIQTMVKILLNVKRIDLIFEILKSSQAHLITPRLFASIIGYFGKNNDFEAAENVWKSSPWIQSEVICVNAMMNVYVLSQEYSKIIELMTDVQKRNVVLDDISYATALNCCALSKDLAVARAIFSTCPFKHSSSVLNSYLKVLIACAETDEAMQLLEDPQHAKCIDTISCNQLLHVTCVPHAFELFDRIWAFMDKGNIERDAVSYTFYSRRLAMAPGTTYQDMEQLFDRVVSTRTSLDSVFYASFFQRLARLRSPQTMNLVEKIIKHMEENGVVPVGHTLLHLLEVYLRNGEVYKALRLVPQLRELNFFPYGYQIERLMGQLNAEGDKINMMRLWLMTRGHSYWTDEKLQVPVKIYLRDIAFGSCFEMFKKCNVEDGPIPSSKLLSELLSSRPQKSESSDFRFEDSHFNDVLR